MYIQDLTLMGPLELQVPPPLFSALCSSSSLYFAEFQKTYLQGKNRDADIENGLVDTMVGKERVG